MKNGMSECSAYLGQEEDANNGDVEENGELQPEIVFNSTQNNDLNTTQSSIQSVQDSPHSTRNIGKPPMTIPLSPSKRANSSLLDDPDFGGNFELISTY